MIKSTRFDKVAFSFGLALEQVTKVAFWVVTRFKGGLSDLVVKCFERCSSV